MSRRPVPPLARILIPVSAAALAGAVLPVPASATAAGDPPFSGYASTAVAAPVRIEVYEPTIPIPATPQLELQLGYTKVEADSGSSQGRASWLWPGDPVGEGAKTFGEQLGLPPQLFENGYPVQVNSSQPSGEDHQEDEPFPGTVMRTRATPGRTVAQAGFSPDGRVDDGTGSGPDGSGGSGGSGDGGSGGGGLPQVPGLPPLPGPGGLTGSGAAGDGLLSQFGQAITGGATAPAATAEPGSDDPPPDAVPGLGDLAAVVDVEGYTSTTQNVFTGARVTSTAHAALGDVSLVGGAVVLEGVSVTSSSTSDGTHQVPTGKATLGGVVIAGQEFSFGPGGFEAAGRHTDIPQLPDDPAKALEQLGITLTLPKPDLEKDGDSARSTVAGLVVDIDTGVLHHQLDSLPIGQLIDALPDDPPDLKKAVQTLAGLSPRVVLTLGTATSKVETVQPIDLPTGTGTGTPGGAGDGSGAGTAGGGGGTAAGPTAATGGPVPAGSGPGSSGGAAPAADGDLPPNQLTGSGLPPLYSIPGAVLAAGIALAALGGSWLRRVGVLALGGGASCAHGLDSGLPDLRKA